MIHPSVTGKELHPLNQLQLAGFRLHPGPLPEEYRGLAMVHSRQRRHKAKKHKYRWDVVFALLNFTLQLYQSETRILTTSELLLILNNSQ